jgi:hypothetical protein
VAITLNLKELEVRGIGSFVELHKLVEAAGMGLDHVKRLLEVANGELPKIEQMHRDLLRDVMNLNQKKRDAEAAILKLNGDFICLRNTADHQRLECEKQESEKRDLYLKKTRLESAIKQLQNSQGYNKIEMIVKQQANKMFGDDKQLLKFAFEAIIESLLKNPYRLQSFMEYLMSIAFTSNSLCNANYSGDNERQPSLFSQCYLSSTYDDQAIKAPWTNMIIV